MVNWQIAKRSVLAEHEPHPMESCIRVVRVPRSALAWSATLTWAELTAAAAQGEQGSELWFVTASETTPPGFAHLREAPAGGWLEGKWTLLHQGW